MAPPVFKTGGRRAASSAGSIPVRLRVDSALGMADCGVGPRSWTRAAGCQERASYSSTPPGRSAGAARRDADQGGGHPRPGSGSLPGGISPASVTDAGRPRFRRPPPPLPGDQRGGRSHAHQSRPRAAVGCRVTQRGSQQDCAHGSSIRQTAKRGRRGAGPRIGEHPRSQQAWQTGSATHHLANATYRPIGCLAAASQPAMTGVHIDAARCACSPTPANGSLSLDPPVKCLSLPSFK